MPRAPQPPPLTPQLLQSPPARPVWLLAGPEEFAVELLVRALERARGVRAEAWEAGRATGGQLRRELSTPSLFGRERLVLLRGADALRPADWRELGLPLRGVTLVAWGPRLQLPPELRSWLHGAIPPRGPLLRRWTLYFAWEVGRELDPEAAELLELWWGDDLRSLRNELHKAALHAGDSPRLRREDVEAVVSPRPLDNPGQLLRSLRDPGRALLALEGVLEAGVHPLAVLAAVLKCLREEDPRRFRALLSRALWVDQRLKGSRLRPELLLAPLLLEIGRR